MINNLIFLSHGVQVAIFFIFVVIVLMFMKIASLENKIKQLDEACEHYISAEEYLESFNNMFEERERGRKTSTFKDDEDDEGSTTAL
jgi:predicted Holliday junction resolvase-like endonuclease